jgi:hypothetical protein
MRSYKQEDWTHLINAPVEIRKLGQTIRIGVVDNFMPDSSALWIAAEGIQPRQIFEAAHDYEVWVVPQELSGKIMYRMASNLLLR